MIVVDTVALRKSAERTDTPLAVVSRSYLAHLLNALENPGNVKLLTEVDAPASMVTA